ncbi:conserved hypothetical protein [Culex quinquefasciatus]|uniref:MULE transposase domain-containing protein n=1 Tax=Culex quinquefasciatus TaxID=7176 RepID=B0X9I7_CULQU|nr:conserved hypothetical protein [Culex quinquefasciatus]|eukprot:XP_001866309.1 conserved hypothetical protein [Culex quinquefasciatus]
MRKHVGGDQYKCPGRLVTRCNGTHRHVATTLPQHTHLPDPDAVLEHDLRNTVKEMTKVNMDPPAKLLAAVAAKFPSRVQTRVSKNAQTLLVKRSRPAPEADPKTIEEFEVPETLKLSIDGEKFYQGYAESSTGDRAYIFTTKSDIEGLSEARFWTADGTFNVSPLLSQLFSIHGSIPPLHQTTTPAVYVFMTSKSQELYTAVLTELLFIADKYRVKLQPRQVLTDFELGMVNSFRTTFPKAKHSLCFFHLTQSLRRKYVALGCAKLPDRKGVLNHHFKLVQALAFLPPNDIPAAFAELKKVTPAPLLPWMQYVEHVYVLGRPASDGSRIIGPTFDPELWSVHDNVMRGIPRTTNNHESWHSRMSKLINIKRVRVWKLVEALRLEQKSAEGRVLSAQRIVVGKFVGKFTVYDGTWYRAAPEVSASQKWPCMQVTRQQESANAPASGRSSRAGRNGKILATIVSRTGGVLVQFPVIGFGPGARHAGT